ncbi:MAG: hypothetical protein ACLGID_21610, partial [Gammaproteobacteria bacterium]
HFHTDHPVFSCSKIEQKQLNTWVSFQSAEQPLLGQFSVSGNTKHYWQCSAEGYGLPHSPAALARGLYPLNVTMDTAIILRPAWRLISSKMVTNSRRRR